MDKFRKYGQPPFPVVLLHGGPGAPGSMAPVARRLSSEIGVIEPFQYADTISGQVSELSGVIETEVHSEVILVGYSWGAWLAIIFTSMYPGKVRKLVQLSCPPFTEEYADTIATSRAKRLSDVEKDEVLNLSVQLNSGGKVQKTAALARIGKIMETGDSYSLLPHPDDIIEYQPDIFVNVWSEAAQLRKSGRLLESVSKITCPIVLIHGLQDPHPLQGVIRPLSTLELDFRAHSLDKCGHTPWYENESSELFYSILRKEIRKT